MPAKKKATRKTVTKKARRNGALYFTTKKQRDAARKVLRGQGYTGMESWQNLRTPAGQPAYVLTAPGSSSAMEEDLLGQRNPKRKPAKKRAKKNAARSRKAAAKNLPLSGKKSSAKKKAAKRKPTKNNPTPRVSTVKPAGHKANCKCPFCKRARRKARRTNPEAEEIAAAQLYTDFHGKEPRHVREITQRQEYPIDVADLGKLLKLDVYIDGDSKRTTIEAKGNIRVVSTPDGGALYFLSGDQSIDLEAMGLDYVLPKDHVEIGPVHTIHYHTKKGFHNFDPVDYYHRFGEANGTMPTLVYDTRNKLIFLTGGTYQVKPEGIVN